MWEIERALSITAVRVHIYQKNKIGIFSSWFVYVVANVGNAYMPNVVANASIS